MNLYVVHSTITLNVFVLLCYFVYGKQLTWDDISNLFDVDVVENVCFFVFVCAYVFFFF